MLLREIIHLESTLVKVLGKPASSTICLKSQAQYLEEKESCFELLRGMPPRLKHEGKTNTTLMVLCAFLLKTKELS